MNFYIIENEHGNTMDYNGYFNCQISQTELFDEPNEPAKLAEELGGHVVELVEAPAKIVVSEEEADMLEKAKHNPTLRPSFMITEYSTSHKGYILGNDIEDRLMRAYVIGWTVDKPKRYVLPMPGTEYRSKLMHGNAQYYAIKGTGNWRPDAIALGTDDAVKHGYTVTKSEIDTAPEWVKGITPIEVTE